MTRMKAPERPRPPGGPMGGGPMAGFGMPVQKARDARGTLRRLLTYLRPRRVALAAVVLLAALSTAFSIFSPKLLGNATTLLFTGLTSKARGGPGADFTALAHIVETLAAVYLVSTLLSFLQGWIMSGAAQATVFDLRRDARAKLDRLPLRYFDAHPHGEVMSRLTNDVETISSTLQQSLTQFITSATTVLGVFVMMLLISPLMTLVALVTLPLSFLATAQIARRSQGHFRAQQATLGQLNGHVEEMLAGHLVVKAFGQERASVARFGEMNARLYDAAWRAQFISGLLFPLMNVVSNAGYVLVTVLGGFLVAQRGITIGDLQAFIQYSRQFSFPIAQLASIANIVQSTLAAAERVFELLDEPEETPDTAPVPFTPRGAVRFEDVTFSYQPGQPVIRHFNLDVPPGRTVAIVGPTGAGKTTLVNLLLRFYEVDSGRILLDGVDARAVPRGEWRRAFGLVLQDTWLFSGTIRDNIAYGRAGATDAQITAAARAAHADHFIRTLPLGYDTVLNEEATNISQGQKQLITIARAILADPAVLLLDEATSSVDTRTELQIRHATTALRAGRTGFVIAHRLSTIRDADLILVMNGGEVVEQGTHEALLAQNGFYAELFHSQFGGVTSHASD